MAKLLKKLINTTLILSILFAFANFSKTQLKTESKTGLSTSTNNHIQGRAYSLTKDNIYMKKYEEAEALVLLAEKLKKTNLKASKSNKSENSEKQFDFHKKKKMSDCC